MDVASIAASLLGAKAAQTQTALAATMMKMDAEAGDAVATLLQSASDNADALIKAAAPGVGTILDIMV